MGPLIHHAHAPLFLPLNSITPLFCPANQGLLFYFSPLIQNHGSCGCRRTDSEGNTDVGGGSGMRRFCDTLYTHWTWNRVSCKGTVLLLPTLLICSHFSQNQKENLIYIYVIIALICMCIIQSKLSLWFIGFYVYSLFFALKSHVRNQLFLFFIFFLFIFQYFQPN